MKSWHDIEEEVDDHARDEDAVLVGESITRYLEAEYGFNLIEYIHAMSNTDLNSRPPQET